MEEKKFFIGILVALFVLSDAVEKKCSLRFMKLKHDIKKNRIIDPCNNHSNTSVCEKEFTISLVSYSPHDYGLCGKFNILNRVASFENILLKCDEISFKKIFKNIYVCLGLLKEFILMPCCDGCIRYKIVNQFSTLADFLNSTTDMNATKADFVIPIMAPKSTLKIYGYDYYPITNAPSGVYITLNPTSTKVHTLLKACFEMWPLLIVCIAMAFIAGFITWLLVSIVT